MNKSISRNINIGEITKHIKNNNQNIKIKLEVYEEFEQSNVFIIKKKQGNSFNIECSQENSTENSQENENKNNDYLDTYNNSICYKENEVINIPKNLNDLFDNLLEDNYYLYGIPKKNSFLISLLYILSPDFKFKKENKNIYIEQLKSNLVKELPKYFKNGYSKLNFNRNNIIEAINNENENNENIDKSVIYYLSEYYNINLIVLDYYKMKYIIGREYIQDKKNVIIVYTNNLYLPLIHIYGEYPNNLIFKQIINKLGINNKIDLTDDKSSSVVLEPKESKQENNEHKDSKNDISLEPEKFNLNLKLNLKLKSISSYKLVDLQELATKYDIAIKNEKGKNKIKSELYNALSLL